jgi:outer membrane immunogenic protein
MGNRTLGIIAALGLLAPVSAYADQPGGDIVDQILRTLPPSPVHPESPGPVAAANPPAPSPVPVSPAPSSPAPAPVAAVGAPTSPAATVTADAAAPGSPAPSTAAPAPNGGDILVQAQQAPPLSTDSTGQWTGFYLGGNLGYGTTRSGTSESCLNSVTNSSSGCDIIDSPALHTSGILGGGQVGYMMPFSSLNLGLNLPPLMIGVEADMQGSGIGKTQNVSGPFNFVGFPGPTCSPCNFTASQQIDWFSTVRARIGVPVDNLFFYGTGGMIFGSIKASQSLNFTGTPQGNIGTVSKVASGPTAGAGVEILLGGPFSAKFEGLYYDLGNLRVVATPVAGAPANFTDFKTFGFRGMLFRLGINVKLGGLGGS